MVFKSNTAYIDTDVFLLGRNTVDTTTGSGISGNLVAKITASDGVYGDQFGLSVAIGSDVIVVGAPQDDDNGSDSGSAYIFNTSGTQLAKIKPSDGAALDYFGGKVAVGSGRIVVAAYGDDDNGSFSGSAYIFNTSGTQLAKIKPSSNTLGVDGGTGDAFGSSIAVGCGRVVIGAHQDGNSDQGSVYIFDINGNQINKISHLLTSIGSGGNFGYSVDVGCGRIVVGAPYYDSVSTDNFGYVGIFDLNGNLIATLTSPDSGDNFYYGISVSVGSGRIVVGETLESFYSSRGRIHIYDLNGNFINTVSNQSNMLFDGSKFGFSTAVSSGYIAVGAPYYSYNFTESGYVGIFNQDALLDTTITAIEIANESYINFGYSVAINKDRLVVGTPAGYKSGVQAGAAYIYTLPSQPHFLDILDEY